MSEISGTQGPHALPLVPDGRCAASGMTLGTSPSASRWTLSPLPPRYGILRGSLPATGRGWAHPPVSRGSGRRLEGERMARDPGGLTATVAVSRQQWRGVRRPPKRHMARARKGRGPQICSRNQKSPHAGAARQPGDLQRSQGARRGSQEGLPRPSGPVRTRPWVAHVAPAHPSHLRPSQHHGRRRRTARAWKRMLVGRNRHQPYCADAR